MHAWWWRVAAQSRESPCVKRGGGNVFFGGASWWREAREGEGVSHVYDQSRVRFFMQLAGFSFCGWVGGCVVELCLLCNNDCIVWCERFYPPCSGVTKDAVGFDRGKRKSGEKKSVKKGGRVVYARGLNMCSPRRPRPQEIAACYEDRDGARHPLEFNFLCHAPRASLAQQSISLARRPSSLIHVCI